MIRLVRKIDPPASVQTTVTLPLAKRVKSRVRVILDDGTEAGLFLARGTTLCDGECLASEEGIVVQVRAAPEPVSTTHCGDPRLLARAAYHLGNRHVPLQIGRDWLRYQHDHVLDDMLRGLGLEVQVEDAPFEPEPGAYGGHEHRRAHEHD